ncbi:hypothetical protein [Sulfuracidifex metallicus]|uniref:Uncharacterized protein n=1 Tax=Sulfuracidifex metallicus DSM 6482 = JCM 9184 TaxID=523847 RepID=A0A6A9QR58_SULME|nr:hypothetical protein [Sulfuracidifex metallicus]MUN29671.1 hypothetical protein [Sulfuracidifex metallicus DSM 6482 = JCM 9184]WOE49822.1 hypothetical protein RQ359_001303 [Sulfuracidifex metallicus DSM 6482 = JCM 9184]
MKIGVLRGKNGDITNLVNAVSISTSNGKREDIMLTYEKIESLKRTDLLIARGLLDGEKGILRNFTELLIDLEPLKEINVETSNVEIGKFGLCVEGSCVKIGHLLPIRDNVFKEVSVVDILDLGILKEVNRIIKDKGTLRLFLRDKSMGGPDPKKIVGYIEASRFIVIEVKAHQFTWEYRCSKRTGRLS